MVKNILLACVLTAAGGYLLGSILFGFATPTEGAGCGAAGAFLLALAYRRLTFKKVFEALGIGPEEQQEKFRRWRRNRPS